MQSLVVVAIVGINRLFATTPTMTNDTNGATIPQIFERKCSRMGRPYKGLTNKVTVKFTDAELNRIARYGQRKPDWKSFTHSEVIREMCDNAALTVELSDVIQNKLDDLEDVAKVFDDIPGMEIYAKAVREAACVMEVIGRYGQEKSAKRPGR